MYAIRSYYAKVRKKLPNFVDESSLNHLLDDQDVFERNFSGIRDKLIIALFYGTGIRLAELIGLREQDINRHERLIRVLGKRQKERIIPYPAEINNLFEEYVIARNREFGRITSYNVCYTKLLRDDSSPGVTNSSVTS